MRIISITPNPEDRYLACPATLAALQRAGHKITLLEGVDKNKVPDFDLCIGPSPQSQDKLHEEAGRNIRSLLSERGGVWWEWALWYRLRMPTLLYSFDETEMNDLRRELHRLQDRSAYERFLRGRAWTVSISASRFIWKSLPEKTYAEEFHESICRDGGWQLGEPRQLDPANPLGRAPESVI